MQKQFFEKLGDAKKSANETGKKIFRLKGNRKRKFFVGTEFEWINI